MLTRVQFTWLSPNDIETVFCREKAERHVYVLRFKQANALMQTLFVKLHWEVVRTRSGNYVTLIYALPKDNQQCTSS